MSRTASHAGSPKWKAGGWKTAARKPVKNRDLWQELDDLHGTAGASSGAGSRAMPATRATSAPTNWPGRAWRPSCRRTCGQARRGTRSKIRPAGMQRIIPMLNYADAPAAIDFLVRAFDFRERRVYPMPDGRIGHAELALGDNVVMLASVFPEMGQTTPARGREDPVPAAGTARSSAMSTMSTRTTRRRRPQARSNHRRTGRPVPTANATTAPKTRKAIAGYSASRCSRSRKRKSRR